MSDKDSTRSTSRVISVLNCFSPEYPELNAVQLSDKTNIPMTTTYRILAGLVKGRLLERNKDNNNYRIGSELFMIGSLYLNSTNINRVAEPVIKTLNNLTNEAVNIGILDRGSLLVIMKEESKSAFRISVHIGTTMPAYSSAMGKALLSELNETDLDSLYPDEILKPLTSQTIPTKTQLKKELEEIRKNGVSFAREESIEKVVGIGAVIRDAEGNAVAALSISVPVFRIDEIITQKISRLVQMATNLISHKLGYRSRGGQAFTLEEIINFWQHEDSATYIITRR